MRLKKQRGSRATPPLSESSLQLQIITLYNEIGLIEQWIENDLIRSYQSLKVSSLNFYKMALYLDADRIATASN